MAITGDFQRFQWFNFETSFLRNENYFEKLEYWLLHESTAIEHVISMQHFLVNSQCQHKQNGEYKMNLSQDSTNY